MRKGILIGTMLLALQITNFVETHNIDVESRDQIIFASASNQQSRDQIIFASASNQQSRDQIIFA